MNKANIKQFAYMRKKRTYFCELRAKLKKNNSESKENT